MEHSQYLYRGLHGHDALVPFAWVSVLASFVAFVLFLIPATRKNFFTLNLGCLLIYAGVYIEKGMALVIPGFTPSTLGEIFEYTPTMTEVRIGAAIFSVGFLVFTLLCKVAVPIIVGDFSVDSLEAEGSRTSPEAEASA
jgi:molybdopterin-containing oxidoreductase family membrane subunit